jgi:hypothetical protein
MSVLLLVAMLAGSVVLDKMRNPFEQQHPQNYQQDDVSHDITSNKGYATPLRKL